jgi:hypothetical protein
MFYPVGASRAIARDSHVNHSAFVVDKKIDKAASWWTHKPALLIRE